jgi:hypothetical protein
MKTPEILPVASSNKAHSPKDAQPAEAKVVEALNDAAYHLSWSVSKAQSRNNENDLRNYWRKRGQVKRLHADLSTRVSQNMSLEEEKIGSKYLDPISERYVLSVEAKWPDTVKSLVRQSIMNEFWSRTLKRAAKFPRCSQSARTENSLLRPSVIVSVCHTTAGDESEENKFAGLPNEVSAPHTNQLQQQFQQLQAQMRQLQRQLQDRPAHTGVCREKLPQGVTLKCPIRLHGPGVGSTTKVPIIITMLQNHLAKLAIGIKPLAIVLNIIKGPWHQRTLPPRRNSPTRPSQHVR